jgi:trehalose/maltose hydrolase-like predicted phosphorylase
MNDKKSIEAKQKRVAEKVVRRAFREVFSKNPPRPLPPLKFKSSAEKARYKKLVKSFQKIWNDVWNSRPPWPS